MRNCSEKRLFFSNDYTTTKEKGELQPGDLAVPGRDHYTTTREKGELQPALFLPAAPLYYTTTREKVKRNSPPPTFHEPVHRV